MQSACAASCHTLRDHHTGQYVGVVSASYQLHPQIVYSLPDINCSPKNVQYVCIYQLQHVCIYQLQHNTLMGLDVASIDALGAQPYSIKACSLLPLSSWQLPLNSPLPLSGC